MVGLTTGATNADVQYWAPEIVKNRPYSDQYIPQSSGSGKYPVIKSTTLENGNIVIAYIQGEGSERELFLKVFNGLEASKVNYDNGKINWDASDHQILGFKDIGAWIIKDTYEYLVLEPMYGHRGADDKF